MALAILNLLAEADRTGRPIRSLAEEAALSRFERVKLTAENPSLRGRLMNVGLSLYRNGFLPGRLVGRMALGYFYGLPVFSGTD